MIFFLTSLASGTDDSFSTRCRRGPPVQITVEDSTHAASDRTAASPRSYQRRGAPPPRSAQGGGLGGQPSDGGPVAGLDQRPGREPGTADAAYVRQAQVFAGRV